MYQGRLNCCFVCVFLFLVSARFLSILGTSWFEDPWEFCDFRWSYFQRTKMTLKEFGTGSSTDKTSPKILLDFMCYSPFITPAVIVIYVILCFTELLNKHIEPSKFVTHVTCALLNFRTSSLIQFFIYSTVFKFISVNMYNLEVLCGHGSTLPHHLRLWNCYCVFIIG